MGCGFIGIGRSIKLDSKYLLEYLGLEVVKFRVSLKLSLLRWGYGCWERWKLKGI